MKIVTVGYVPGPHYGHPKKFLENILAFERKFPLLLYSFHDYGPDVIRIKGDPEQIEKGSSPFTIENFVTLTGFRIAQENQADYVILLEPDCRVGDDMWDDTMVSEFFSKQKGALIGGSMVVHSPCNFDMEFARKWSDVIAANNVRKNFPIATYSRGGQDMRSMPCVFVLGALGIYKMETILGAFNGLKNTREVARKVHVWDKAIGIHIFETHLHRCFEKVVHLNSIYSSYGNVLTSEDDRKHMLSSGEVVAVHQIKSDWKGPQPV